MPGFHDVAVNEVPSTIHGRAKEKLAFLHSSLSLIVTFQNQKQSDIK